MKVLFLVLALALFANLSFAQFTYPTPEEDNDNEVPDTETEVGAEPEWVKLKSKDYKKGTVKDLLDDGADFVIDTNIKSGALSNTDFERDTITKVEKQTVENGTNYRFTVVVNDGEVKAEAVYVTYHPNKGADVIKSSSLQFYDRLKHGEDGGAPGQNAWTRVSLSSFHKSESMEEAFDEGVDDVIAQGIAHEILPNSTFEVSEPNYRAKVKVRNGGTKYRFQAEIRNEFGAAKITFVSYKGKVVSYFVDHSDIVIPEPQAPEAPETPEESEEEAEEETPEDSETEAPEVPEEEAETPEDAQETQPEASEGSENDDVVEEEGYPSDESVDPVA